ncbi:BQ2448_5767 [Microbotryum intermedium]|uniref:BQ2448_5767 protein n=1 Tax=Microbotryum intermedium TaxID=269621 RepID=A0A238F575_9BASI|nr:BQ2448_5767 [Microbotryum intermedium]
MAMVFMHYPCTIDAEGAFENMLGTVSSTTMVRKLELKLHFYDEDNFFACEDGITDWVMRGVLPQLSILNMEVIATAPALGDDGRMLGLRWDMLGHACQRRRIAFWD